MPRSKKSAPADRPGDELRDPDSDSRGIRVVIERRSGQTERRNQAERRSQVDPATCERDYTDEEIAFMQAMDQYKREHRRPFPTYSEILDVLKTLGYRKIPEASEPLQVHEAVRATEDQQVAPALQSPPPTENQEAGSTTSYVPADTAPPAVANDGGATKYEYDALGRLTSITMTGVTNAGLIQVDAPGLTLEGTLTTPTENIQAPQRFSRNPERHNPDRSSNPRGIPIPFFGQRHAGKTLILTPTIPLVTRHIVAAPSHVDFQSKIVASSLEIGDPAPEIFVYYVWTWMPPSEEDIKKALAGLPEEPRACLTEIRRRHRLFCQEAAAKAQPAIQFLLHNVSDDAEARRADAQQIDQTLRAINYAIRDPQTGQPTFLADAGGRAAFPESVELVAAEHVLLSPQLYEPASTEQGTWAERVRLAPGTYNPYEPLPPVSPGSWQDVAKQVLKTLKERLPTMPHETYEDKKKMAAWINAELRQVDLAIKCPKTGRPSILKGDPGGRTGRFMVQNRNEQGREARPFSTSKLETLLKHLTLMPADPRMRRLARWDIRPSAGPSPD